MPGPLPDGDPAPDDGSLPAAAVQRARGRGFGVYVHVPFCTVRCGYCDFNTYTAEELRGGVSVSSYPELVLAEIELAAAVLDGAGPVQTVFFGGGTPSLLPAAGVGALLGRLDSAFGLATGAEVTLEANPESVSAGYFAELVAVGVNRVSLGMQSAVPSVLDVLDRPHRPERVAEAVAEARSAGIEQLSVDLIYGTPGETDADWLASLHAALDLDPDHVSAYSLTVEPGTRLAARVARGEVAAVDEDILADRYQLADDVLGADGYRWYEISNWTKAPAARCRHNLGYWTGANWWGFGPGAHSHVGGVRWWNVRHPSAYADRVRAGRSPAAGREQPSPSAAELEQVMLGVRLADGLPLSGLPPRAVAAARAAAADGLAEAGALQAGRVVLTLRGRLLADTVVQALTD
jgi:putative oxygen-independent coproporphyrinogen III oxidase